MIRLATVRKARPDISGKIVDNSTSALFLPSLNPLEGRRSRFMPWIEIHRGAILDCRRLHVSRLFLDHASR
jgi:hypothetical protein